MPVNQDLNASMEGEDIMTSASNWFQNNMNSSKGRN